MPQQAPIYQPIQLITIYEDYLSANPSVFGRQIYLQGIYQPGNGNSYGGYYYDRLKDEHANTLMTILVPGTLRPSLRSGNLVVLVGGMAKKIDRNNGSINLQFRVDNLVEKKQEKTVNDEDLKRIDLIQQKNSKGKKNVSALLEAKLMRDEHPKVQLLFALSSITDRDFDAGINAAASQIDFVRERVAFQTNSLCPKLRQVDLQGYDAVCIIRGGGGGMDKLDDLQILQTIVSMNTPVISALGHVAERFSIKDVVDYPAPTPNGLAQYFSEMVERVSKVKTDSDSVRTAKIKAMFQKQLDDSNKKNKDLLAQLEKIQKDSQKQNQDQTKTFKESLDAAQKANAKLQVELQKANSQNLQSVKELATAKETIAQLKASGGGISVGAVVAIVILVAVIAFIIGGMLL